MFVVRKGSRVLWDGTQLSGNRSPVMVRPATPTSAAWLTSNGIPFQTDAATVKQIGQMLAAKRGDVALLLAMEAELLHRQAEFAGQLQTLVPRAATAHGYAVFNREFAEANRPLVEAIWNEIGRIRTSAEWKAFATKFERDRLHDAEAGGAPSRPSSIAP